jgi:hypothetical protein
MASVSPIRNVFMNSNVIVVAGLPGSGKSRIMDELKNNGYSRYNDINKNWDENISRVLLEIRQGLKVAISDIIFCDKSWRKRLEDELCVSVQWIFMENDPWQCAKNCLFRFAYQKAHRPLHREIEFIRAFSPNYFPYGDIRPVPRADEQIPDEWAGKGNKGQFADAPGISRIKSKVRYLKNYMKYPQGR